jgi:hypothetical protein
MTEIQTIELNSLGSTYDTDRGSAIGNEVKVTVLPPGEACGARDLQRWSKQRLKGQAGVPLTSRERNCSRKSQGVTLLIDGWLRQAEERRTKKVHANAGSSVSLRQEQDFHRPNCVKRIWCDSVLKD